MTKADPGLGDVVAADTVLSDVDGAGGRLIIRGWPVEIAASRLSFAQAALLLWSDLFDDLPDANALEQRLGFARAVCFAQMQSAPDHLNAVEALRFMLSAIADGDDLETAIRLTAATHVFSAAQARRAHGMAAIAPDATLAASADFLRMLRGAPVEEREVAALDSYLVTVCDHGLNASTFAARVAASTQAGLTSAVIAGLSTLKGPLHGGAPGPVLDMFDAIGAPENAERWIDDAFARGERLMGFGHRIYRVRDPRADALKAALQKLPSTAGRLAYAQAIEQHALKKLAVRYPTRALDTNVEFYTALLLEALQIPRASFTCVFAMGRVLGWIAHAREQLATGRIVRPQSRYVGPSPRQAA
jgi:citrate synthase